MKHLPNNSTPAEKKFWTSLKTFFFCDADTKIDQQDMLWIYLLVLVSGIAVITCAYGLIGSLFS